MIEDMKIYALNITTLAISFSNIDMALKLLLLTVSIGYTVHKWWLMSKSKSS